MKESNFAIGEVSGKQMYEYFRSVQKFGNIFYKRNGFQSFII
jgi:hypothetical protein